MSIIIKERKQLDYDKKIIIRTYKSDIAQVKQIARQHKVSMNELFNQLIKQVIAQEKGKEPENII
jgi:predicted HicB family RNase H-like nuclease